MELGIIGFGRFGRLAAGILKQYFDVFVFDIVDKRREAAENNRPRKPSAGRAP